MMRVREADEGEEGFVLTGAGEIVLVVANHMIIEWIFYATVALTFSTKLISDRYLVLKPVLDRISAVILGGLGLRLIFSR